MTIILLSLHLLAAGCPPFPVCPHVKSPNGLYGHSFVFQEKPPPCRHLVYDSKCHQLLWPTTCPPFATLDRVERECEKHYRAKHGTSKPSGAWMGACMQIRAREIEGER